MKFKNKKGQLGALSELAVGVAVLSILLVVAFLIMSQGKIQSVDLSDTGVNINDTRTITVNATHNIGECVNTEDMSVVVYNSSAGPNILLTAGNYTISKNTINVSDFAISDGVNSIDSSVNITFSCKRPDHTFNSTSTLQNATNTIPGWVPLLIITIIGSVLLSLVAMFRRNK